MSHEISQDTASTSLTGNRKKERKDIIPLSKENSLLTAVRSWNGAPVYRSTLDPFPHP